MLWKQAMQIQIRNIFEVLNTQSIFYLILGGSGDKCLKLRKQEGKILGVRNCVVLSDSPLRAFISGSSHEKLHC